MIGLGRGSVAATRGDFVLARLPRARVGAGVTVAGRGALLRGRVAALDGTHAVIAPFGSIDGVGIGDVVAEAPGALQCILGYAALGRAIDAAGGALDGGPPLAGRPRPLDADAASDLRRPPVRTPFTTGIRAIDGLLVLGRGARVGLFGAPGVGKTTLLETIAAGAAGDAVVVGLVGERGREAATWLDRLDGRTTIVCATSDRSAPERVRAAELAMAQAVALRDRGLHVVLILDSLARYVAALRETRVALGEAVGRGGYPPAVFAELARFLERAGTAPRGSITLLATVLSDGGDEREPLGDAARSLLDGHIVLSPEIARAGRFPAIDVLASTSRTMHDVVDPGHAAAAAVVRDALARLHASADARAVGLGSLEDDPALAAAVACEPALRAFLEQRGAAAAGETRDGLFALAEALEDR